MSLSFLRNLEINSNMSILIQVISRYMCIIKYLYPSDQSFCIYSSAISHQNKHLVTFHFGD